MNADSVANKIPVMVVLLLCVAMGFGLWGEPVQHRDRMMGQTIEAFSIPELGAQEMLSPANWQGKTVVINIFATWCEPCKMEHPVLLRLAKATTVPIYGIVWKDKDENVKTWLAGHGNPYALVAMDNRGDTTIPFAMTGVPETFVIASDGTVRFHTNSMLTDEVVEKRILPLLASLEKKP